MDYVLYTSNARYWNTSTGEYNPPQVECIVYPNADKCSVLEEIYDVNDSMQGYCFWLGADAEEV